MSRILRLPAASLLSLLLLACASCASRGGATSAGEPSFEIPVRVSSEAEQPVAGVALRIGAGAAVVTGADGTARLTARGRTGDAVEIHAACPDGYVSPAAPLSITLYHVVAGAAAPARAITCTRTARRVIAAIRIDRGVRLPIVRFGQAIGATDDLGAAHVAIDGKPGERVELTLDTSGAEHGALRPHSPTLSFAMPERDGLLVLEQQFEKVSPSKRQPTRGSRAPSPASTLPTRI